MQGQVDLRRGRARAFRRRREATDHGDDKHCRHDPVKFLRLDLLKFLDSGSNKNQSKNRSLMLSKNHNLSLSLSQIQSIKSQ